jgi:hypothetical protein
MDPAQQAMYQHYMQQQHQQMMSGYMMHQQNSASLVQTPLPHSSADSSSSLSFNSGLSMPMPIPPYLGVSPSSLASDLDGGAAGGDGGINRAKWLESEDAALRNAVAVHGARNWRVIAAEIPSRSDVQCLHRWQKVLRPGLVKGPWTFEEDEKVKQLVGLYGTKRWSEISSHLEGRLGKQVCEEFVYDSINPLLFWYSFRRVY